MTDCVNSSDRDRWERRFFTSAEDDPRMRTFGAFAAGVGVAAMVSSFASAAVPLRHGLIDALLIFAAGSLFNFLLVFPVALIGGLPLWCVMRARPIRSPRAFVVAGALLVLAEYLLLAASGLFAPSGHPTTFLERVHADQTAIAIVAGAVGGFVFSRMVLQKIDKS